MEGRDLIERADDVDTLEELEDDFDDDRFLDQYRRQRIKEMMEARTAEKKKYGSVEVIKGREFVREVTDASEECWVICHLYKESVSDCHILNICLDQLSERYPETKFVKIVSTECIPGFPDENLPTLLLYKDKKCVHTITGLGHFGGQSSSPDRVALVLNQHGDVCGSAEQESERHLKGIVKDFVEKFAMKGADDSEDDE